MNRLRTLLALALLVLAPAAARAQIVEGFVLEDSTENPIAGVRVELRGAPATPAVTETDSAGAFRIDLPTRGSYVLRVRHPSYAALDSLPLEVASNERVEVTLKMGRRPIALAPLIVRARADEGVGGFRDRMARGAFGRFISREELDRRQVARTSDLLRTLPGVQVERAGPGEHVVLMRGCVATVFVDGMRVQQRPDSGVDAFVQPSSLEGVEVYSSAATVPAQLQSSSGCGVVAFWTRPGSPGRVRWRNVLLGAGALVGIFLLLAR